MLYVSKNSLAVKSVRLIRSMQQVTNNLFETLTNYSNRIVTCTNAINNETCYNNHTETEHSLLCSD